MIVDLRHARRIDSKIRGIDDRSAAIIATRVYQVSSHFFASILEDFSISNSTSRQSAMFRGKMDLRMMFSNGRCYCRFLIKRVTL